jgi:hypothetical protein
MSALEGAPAPHDDSFVVGRGYRRLRIFWILIAAVTVYLLAERIWLSLAGGNNDPDKWGAWVVVVYGVSLYVLFITEGVSHSAAQLHKADHEGVLDAIQKDTAYSQRKQTKLIEFLNLVFSRFEPFLIGRQIISLSAVAFLAIAIEKSPDVTNDPLGSLLVKFAAWALPPPSDTLLKIVHSIQYFLGGFFAAFLLSALFPCWFSQILPSLLATKGSIRFFNFPGAKPCARAAIYVGRSGAGLPGQVVFDLIKNWKRLGFDTDERIGVGDASTFTHLTATLGECVSSRKIHLDISKDDLVVTDSITVELMGKPRSTVDQTLRVAMTHCGPEEIQTHPPAYQVPNGTAYARASKAAIIAITDKADGTKWTSELLMLAVANLETAIPRQGFSTEKVIFQFQYTCKALSLASDITDVFFFEISKPTRSLKITLHLSPGLFCREPSAKMGNIEEVMLRTFDEEGGSVPFETKMVDGHGRILTRNYPQSGRYGLYLNVMSQDQASADTSHH